MRSVRIGLVGLGFANFEARNLRIFERSRDELGGLTDRCGAELAVYQEVVETAEEAEKAVRYLEDQKIDFLLIQASSFSLGDVLYPLLELKTRFGFWFVPEPSYDGELPLNSLTGFNLVVSICRKYAGSVQYKWFFGWPGNASFDEPLTVTLQALRAVTALPGSRVAQIGSIVPTFDNLAYDSEELAKRLGIEVVPIAVEELFDRCRQVSSKRTKEIVIHLKQRAERVLVDSESLEKTARVIGAMEMLRKEYRLDAAAVKCWPEFQSELDMAPCAALANANDGSFPSGCEGDLVGTISMLIGHMITGSAPTMNDPVAYDEASGAIQMWHCGPGPASWADEAGQTLAYHHTLNRRRDPDQGLAGVSSDISFRKGPVTVMRIEENGKSIFTFEAQVVEGPAKPYPGSGGWFSEFTSDKKQVSIRDMVETISAYGIEHHYPVCFGHIEHVYRELASWMSLHVLPFKTWKPYRQGE